MDAIAVIRCTTRGYASPYLTAQHKDYKAGEEKVIITMTDVSQLCVSIFFSENQYITSNIFFKTTASFNAFEVTFNLPRIHR